MADYNSTFTGAQIDAGITKANFAQQPPAEGPFVDGDKTKLDGIEAGADVTDTANVTAAGALMDSEVTNLAAIKAFDPTDYATAAQGGLADTAVQPGDDANTLGSGAATDGYVLTADGIGGAAWEEASGGGATDYVRTRDGTTQDIFDMADTWNDAGTTFTGIKMNITDTASAAGSLLMDLQVGGVSQFAVDKTGRTFFGEDDVFIYRPTTNVLAVVANNFLSAAFRNNGVNVSSAGAFGFNTTTSGASTPDTFIARDASGIIAQRNGANAQKSRVYNTFTDFSNGEWLEAGFDSNAAILRPQANGTGTVRDLHISGLPTSNPGPGILWNDAGTVKVGT